MPAPQYARKDQTNGTWHTIYDSQILEPMSFYNIIPGSTKLEVTNCRIMFVSRPATQIELPMFEIELPRDARWFGLEAPILAIYNELGGTLMLKAPCYNW